MVLWMVLDFSSDIIYYIDTFVRSRTGKDKINKSRWKDFQNEKV